MKFRTAFNISPDVSISTSISFPKFGEPTVRTDRSFLLSSNLNWMMAEFGQGSKLPQGYAVPEYGDFTDMPDSLQAAMAVVHDATDSFLNLPFAVRSAFGHSAANFVNFCSDKSDGAIAFGRSLGLYPPLPPSPAPVEDKPVPKPKAE